LEAAGRVARVGEDALGRRDDLADADEMTSSRASIMVLPFGLELGASDAMGNGSMFKTLGLGALPDATPLKMMVLSPGYSSDGPTISWGASARLAPSVVVSRDFWGKVIRRLLARLFAFRLCEKHAKKSRFRRVVRMCG
jgi:hypothetical protein